MTEQHHTIFIHCKQQKSINPFPNTFWKQSLAEMCTTTGGLLNLWVVFFICSFLLHKHSYGVWLVTDYSTWNGIPNLYCLSLVFPVRPQHLAHSSAVNQYTVGLLIVFAASGFSACTFCSFPLYFYVSDAYSIQRIICSSLRLYQLQPQYPPCRIICRWSNRLTGRGCGLNWGMLFYIIHCPQSLGIRKN